MKRRGKPLSGSLLESQLYPENPINTINRIQREVDRNQRQRLTRDGAREAYKPLRELNFDGWAETNVAGTQSATVIQRWGGVAVNLSGLRFAGSGSITYLSAALNESLTAGTLTVDVYVDGSDSGFGVTLNSDEPDSNEATAAIGEFVFAANEELTLRLTTSGFTPNTADLTSIILKVVLN